MDLRKPDLLIRNMRCLRTLDMESKRKEPVGRRLHGELHRKFLYIRGVILEMVTNSMADGVGANWCVAEYLTQL